MAAKYHNIPTSDREYDLECGYEEGSKGPGILLRLLSHICTFLSYTVFLLFLPVTYWICIKKVDSSHRIIIFRLGTLIGSRGPGRVLIFPWLDRTLTIDISVSAFSVPPQQLITHDGGIIEIGAEVHYAVTDCVALVSQVADYQEMLRSLAKTVLIRLTVKETISQLNRDKNRCENSVKDEINGQVRKWGLDIRLVEFCEIKVLKAPEKEGGIPPLLATLSRTSGGLTPAEFAKYLYSAERAEKEGVVGVEAEEAISSLVEAVEQDKLTWTQCFQRILRQEKFDCEQYGQYLFLLTDIRLRMLLQICENPTAINIDAKEDTVANVKQVNDLDRKLAVTLEDEINDTSLPNSTSTAELISNELLTSSSSSANIITAATLSPAADTSSSAPDDLSKDLPSAHITISLTSSDLAGILKGSLPSLQAYLTNRINITGDVRKLMLLEKFGTKSHKPGQPFSV